MAGVKVSSRGCSESCTRAKSGVPWGDMQRRPDFCVDEATGSGCLERRGSQQSQARAPVSSTPRELSGRHSLSAARGAVAVGAGAWAVLGEFGTR